MSLFRAIYEREGHIKGMTFWARNEAFAAQYAYTVLQKLVFALGGSWILTIRNAKERVK